MVVDTLLRSVIDNIFKPTHAISKAFRGKLWDVVIMDAEEDVRPTVINLMLDDIGDASAVKLFSDPLDELRLWMVAQYRMREHDYLGVWILILIFLVHGEEE